MKQTIFQNSWNTASTAPRDIYNLTNYFLVLKSLTQETHNTSNSENQHEFFFRKNLIVAKVWKWKSLSRVWLFVNPWIVTCQAPLSWDSPGKNTGVGSHPFPRRIFPTQGLKLVSCITGGVFTIWATREAPNSESRSQWINCFRGRQWSAHGGVKQRLNWEISSTDDWDSALPSGRGPTSFTWIYLQENLGKRDWIYPCVVPILSLVARGGRYSCHGFLVNGVCSSLPLALDVGVWPVLANGMLADTTRGCLFLLLSSSSWPLPLPHRPQNETGGTDQP